MYQINQNILKTPVADGKILLLEPEQGLYFELNEVSVVIFDCVSKGMSHANTLDKLVNVFDVNKKNAETDLLELIQQLIDNNIIVEA